MRLPQRFKRLRNQEPAEDQDIILPAYPLQTRSDVQADMPVYGNDGYEPMQVDTEYTAGANMSERDDLPSRKIWVEALEDREWRYFGTRIISSFYNNVVSGWRAGLLRAFLASVLALIANICVFTLLLHEYKPKDGNGVIHKATCEEVNTMEIGIKVALNVVSTLILGASTYAMQGTTAPTRAEVDTAHKQGKWLEIGTQSWRNLSYVSRRHASIWTVLALTSLPLHLVFNAVFYTTTETYQYAIAVVDHSFLNNTEFQVTPGNSSPFTRFRNQQFFWRGHCDGKNCSWDIWDDSVVTRLLDNVRHQDVSQQTFSELTPFECIDYYSKGFTSKYSDVVVVSNASQPDDPVLWTRYPQRILTEDKEDTNDDPYHWICHDTINNTTGEVCSRKKALKSLEAKPWTVYGHTVDRCLARSAPNVCHLQYNVWIMGAVIVFSTIKVLAIAVLVFTHPEGTFLRTMGDAIASFLEKSDPTTEGMCLVSSVQVRKYGFATPVSSRGIDDSRWRWWSCNNGIKRSSAVAYPPQQFTNHRPRWWAGANTTEFFSTVGISAAYVVILSGVLGLAISETSGDAYDTQIGRPSIQQLAKLKTDDTGSSGIVPTLLTANIPQLGFSLLYVFYTNIWAKLLIAHEFDRMTTSKKGLRVSERRKGEQRTSHFFTLPARYALPLMLCSAVLHWLCSQSLFMARYDGVNSDGKSDNSDQIVRLAYNIPGMTALIAVTFAMAIVTVCIAGSRRLRTGLGEVAMSVVISGACHLKRHEDEPWKRKVQWGDVGHEEVEDGQIIRHCAFSSLEIRSPTEGFLYK